MVVYARRRVRLRADASPCPGGYREATMGTLALNSLRSAVRGSLRARTVGDLGSAAALLGGSVLAAGQALWFWDTPADPTAKPLVLFGGSVDEWHAAAAAWWIAALVATAALLLRRTLPKTAFIAAGLAAGLHLADNRLAQTPIDLAAPACLYTVALLVRTRPAAKCLLVLGIAGACAASAISQLPPPRAGLNVQMIGYQATMPCLLLTAAWFAGDAAGTRREHLRLLEQRAADLERERDQHASLAAATERAHLTRELHDIVAHGISVMVIQAQAAKAVMNRDRTAAQSALDETIDVGRKSLAEMRHLLGVTRRSGPVTASVRSPQPRTEQVPALIEQIRRAGVTVDYKLTGEPVPLPTHADLSVYRIVQEALTNTVKHAGSGAHATVLIEFAPRTLTLEIRDRRPRGDQDHERRQPPDRGNDVRGNGLIGIAERVGTLGGTLRTAHLPDGFLVHAVLPLSGSR